MGDRHMRVARAVEDTGAEGEDRPRRIELLEIDDATPPPDALWIDLHRPDAAQIAAVEALTGATLPTEAQMSEIEASSRLYESRNALFLTGVILSEQDSDRPISRAVTFVLTRSCLVTIRHSNPKPFAAFADQLREDPGWKVTPDHMLLGLWQAIIARSADVVERLSGQIDELNAQVFQSAGRSRPARPETFRKILRRLGEANDLAARIRESMFSLARLMSYPEQAAPDQFSEEFRRIAHRIRRDRAAVSEQVDALSDKIAFLLDVTLGMINVEQSAIIRLLSIAATVFLPPTLIASLYGMNFENMPELSWPYGYPMALGIAALSAFVPYLFFKLRGWL